VLNTVRRCLRAIVCLAGRHRWRPEPGSLREIDGQYVAMADCRHCPARRPHTYGPARHW
jgi:hypothetical protein